MTWEVRVNPEDLDAFLRNALAEDLGRGDVTSELTVAPGRRGEGRFLAKTPLVVAGTQAAARVFALVDPAVTVRFDRADGARLEAGETLGSVEGPARSLLAAERLALNLLQHLSGVATLTRTYADAIAGTRARILDTRKTLPGMRALEKAAVKAGGGFNHRLRLDDGILIKDNHIALAGGLTEAVRRARAGNRSELRIEVEVGTPAQAHEAIAAGADSLLLDNMSLTMLRETVQLVDGRVPLEASGGVGLDTIRAIAETGVDFISVGRLTHSAPAADINLKFRPL
jgi:nicotinate-nucleotide pyrophosphorylase (carboxylating)